MVNLMPLGSVMRVLSRAQETHPAIAADLERELAKDFPPVPLIESDRIEAESRFAGAGAECERLQVELIDLETQYERRREELVTDLANARQAAAAAALWAQALHPGAVLPAEKDEAHG